MWLGQVSRVMEQLNWGYIQLGLVALVFGGLQVSWIGSVFWRRDLARAQSDGGGSQISEADLEEGTAAEIVAQWLGRRLGGKFLDQQKTKTTKQIPAIKPCKYCELQP